MAAYEAYDTARQNQVDNMKKKLYDSRLQLRQLIRTEHSYASDSSGSETTLFSLAKTQMSDDVDINGVEVGTMEHISIPPPIVSPSDGSRDWFHIILSHLPPIMHACADCTGPYSAEESSFNASESGAAHVQPSRLLAKDIFEQDLVAGSDCTAAAVAYHAAQLTQLTRLAVLTSDALEENTKGQEGDKTGDDNDTTASDLFQNLSKPQVASCWFLSDWRLMRATKRSLFPLLISPTLGGNNHTRTHDDLMFEFKKRQTKKGAVEEKRSTSPSIDSSGSELTASKNAIESYTALTSPAARATSVADHYSSIISAGMRDYSVLCVPPVVHRTHNRPTTQEDEESHATTALPSLDTDSAGLALAVISPITTVTAYTDIVKVPLPSYFGGFFVGKSEQWSKEFYQDQLCEATVRHLPSAEEFAWFLADRVGPSLRWLQTADDDIRQRDSLYFGKGDTRSQKAKELGFQNPTEGAAPAALTQYLAENQQFSRKTVGLYAGWRKTGQAMLHPRWSPRIKHWEQGLKMPGLRAMLAAYHSP